MTDNEALVAVFFAATACAIVFMMINALIKLKRPRPEPGLAESVKALEQRFARVEVALDDLSSELTRVAEGQQFVTKVLTDRSAVPAVLPPGAPLR